MFPEMAPKPAPSPGDWATEYLCAKIFDRPARNNLLDTPFYPWLPKPTPDFRVCFKLGFKP